MYKYFSRCSLGKSRAFWCVSEEEIFDGNLPIAHGYETTVEAAEAKAHEVAGEGARAGNTQWARNTHRGLFAKRRRERPAKAKDSHKVDYDYNSTDWSDTTYPGETRTPGATAYRVHKTTKTRLYVEDEPGLIEEIERGLYRDHEFRTFLDRAEIEREGHARSRSKGWWYSDFYASPRVASLKNVAKDRQPKPGTSPPLLPLADWSRSMDLNRDEYPPYPPSFPRDRDSSNRLIHKLDPALRQREE